MAFDPFKAYIVTFQEYDSDSSDWIRYFSGDEAKAREWFWSEHDTAKYTITRVEHDPTFDFKLPTGAPDDTEN